MIDILSFANEIAHKTLRMVTFLGGGVGWGWGGGGGVSQCYFR